MDMDITISIGEGDGFRGRYSACVVEQRSVPSPEGGALDAVVMGYGDTPLAAAIDLLQKAEAWTERRRQRQ